MHDQLKKIYYSLLAPIIAGFIALNLFHKVLQPIGLPKQAMAVIAPALFILSAAFAIAGPILYRSLFAYRQRNLVMVQPFELYKFERNQISMAMVAPYLALVAYFLQSPRFHLTGTLLMALYAIYYHYPFKNRLRFDGKLFRAGDASAIERISPKRTDTISTN